MFSSLTVIWKFHIVFYSEAHHLTCCGAGWKLRARGRGLMAWYGGKGCNCTGEQEKRCCL
ncbi:hypothetical protein PVAP13_2NG281503 [Panicum virgatum]|uniref:Uncharacterized protein n=1 Tax=Panicum virgatum TaxID=38727 RepID=A0A8T0VFS4_PANVG|nr:hypothetical protein PVAP13_2NG281503 [Panicum virgatum]